MARKRLEALYPDAGAWALRHHRSSGSRSLQDAVEPADRYRKIRSRAVNQRGFSSVEPRERRGLHRALVGQIQDESGQSASGQALTNKSCPAITIRHFALPARDKMPRPHRDPCSAETPCTRRRALASRTDPDSGQKMHPTSAGFHQRGRNCAPAICYAM